MLSRAKLKGGMHGVFESGTTNPSIPAGKLAAAYYEYAKTAKSCGAPGLPLAPSIAIARDVLRLALTGVFATPYQNPMDYARAVSVAFGAFWLLPPMGFSGTTPGLVTLAVPLPLQLAITAFLVSNIALSTAGKSPTPDQVEDQWSRALDTWTRSVVVTHAPPSVCATTLT